MITGRWERIESVRGGYQASCSCGWRGRVRWLRGRCHVDLIEHNHAAGGVS